MGLLQGITGPADVRELSVAQCATLAAECRDFLVDAVSRTGGHLGPNLGVVELTIALHRVFDSPRDKIVFDTGHQAYVHKMLTGRQKDFATLKQPSGLSGYPSRAESEHDVIENSHASTALSYADGIAKAWQLRGETERRVIAVVGDGALTGGMSWEALNTIAAARDRPVIMVINDNGRSYAPTTGGLAEHLTALRTEPRYEAAMQAVRGVLPKVPVVGAPAFEALHGLKRGIKDLLVPSAMFEDLGLKYIGPVDGHDVAAVEKALRAARAFGAPVLVHVVTRKGFGYGPAETNMDDCLHGIGTFDAVTGVATPESGGRTFTHVFSDAIVAVGAADPTVVAITASMLQPVGLSEFAVRFPDRVFDVGIAEQHAMTSAAGLAMGGMKPVVALYATFLNRAFDQVLMDVALHELPVTIVLDRAGVTGSDGPSHNGMWDLSMLGLVPGIAIAAPRDAATLVTSLNEAVARTGGPSVVRFPKGPVGADIPAVARVGGADVLHRGSSSDVLVVAVGPLARVALDVAARCADQGIGVTVVDPRWVTPVDPALIGLASAHTLVVTIEDGTRIGGVGTRFAQAMTDAGHTVPVLVRGLDGSFLAQGKRDVLLREAGLGAAELTLDVVSAFASFTEPAMGSRRA